MVMVRWRMSLVMLISVIAFLFNGFILNPARAAAVSRIEFTPASFTLEEGQSQTVTITLSEPIVTSSLDPAFVDLSPTTLSTRTSLSTPTITYLANEWFQSKTFTVTAVDDQLVNGDTQVTYSTIADSNSEYYDGFAKNFTVNVLDNDVAPVTQTNSSVAAATSTQPATPELTKTGNPIVLLSTPFGFFLIGTSIALSIATRVKKTT